MTRVLTMKSQVLNFYAMVVMGIFVGATTVMGYYYGTHAREHNTWLGEWALPVTTVITIFLLAFCILGSLVNKAKGFKGPFDGHTYRYEND